ncbi:MAG: flagellar basal body rod protein FlgC [Pseudobdellovibrionaceae bacterium]
MINVIGSATSALSAQSKRVEATASNIANAFSVGSPDGSVGRAAYAPVDVTLIDRGDGGVTAQVRERDPATVEAFAPDDPSANAEGFVAAPNVNLGEELITMKFAENAYKAAAQLLRMGQDLDDALLNAVRKDA